MEVNNAINPNVKLAVLKTGQAALKGHRGILKGKIIATDMALNKLVSMAEKEKGKISVYRVVTDGETDKENTYMKNLLKGIVAVAAVGAVAGAAYAYYKKNKLSDRDYEELIYTDDADGEFGEVEYVEVETKADEAEELAEDVVDSVSEAFFDVKEAIDNAIEE